MPHVALFNVCEAYAFLIFWKPYTVVFAKRIRLVMKHHILLLSIMGYCRTATILKFCFQCLSNHLLNASYELMGYLEVDSGDIKAGIRHVNADLNRKNQSITRRGLRLNVEKSRVTTTFDKRQFRYSPINFWNTIPEEVVELDSVEKFKFTMNYANYTGCIIQHRLWWFNSEINYLVILIPKKKKLPDE